MLMLLKNNDHKKKTRKKREIERKEGANKCIGAHLKKHIYCKLLIRG